MGLQLKQGAKMSDEQTITESNESQDQSYTEVGSTISTDSGEQNEVERPDWLPPKFETPEQLSHSYQELERKFHTRRDEIKNELVGELNEEASEHSPISPGDYVVELSDQDGNPIEVNQDDPMLGWFRDKAHNYGLSNDEFGDLVSEYTNMQASSGPDWETESQDLGEHADRRLERVDTWANSTLSEDAYSTFAAIPASSAMVKAFEEIMQLNGQPKFNMTSSTEFQETVSKADLMSAQQDPKYWRNGGDPSHIAKVRAMAEQLSKRRA